MTYQITIEPLGQTIEVEEGQTLLDASLRHGVYLPHACGHGLCATCKVQVLDGEVDHGEASSFALMDFERENGQCLACCATPTSDLVIEADIEVEPDAKNYPVEDYRATVTRVEDLTPTIKGIWMKPDRPMTFQAGQYINLDLPVSGGLRRAFSPASAPSRDEIELHVRLVEGGAATTWIHKDLRVGDTLGFSGPYGRFFVRESSTLPLIFLAGGSGLAGVLSMIDDLLEKGDSRPMTLVYGQRTRVELYYHERLLALARQFPHFTYSPALSGEPEDSAWQGERGFVHEVAKRVFDGMFAGHRAYLCGPPVMIEACIKTLMQGRLFEKDIFTEKFITAADASQVRSPLFRNV
ncbi:MAG TPA: 2Fe-2S iron-sulfur cluster binding domain-containing protein [Noviherbaspirillum sp.]|uniref:NADH:ubiquinone reductase (Na(+)-transporting) subunit F n=1 Tax=Noviherbaspirillum sp. TaxID=1926288 RepID=UPI002B4A2D07|nr:2Fe-2S iron-sulfur cluster binding domain-containing protein [Noviherbaspirillum sp.]HJV84995.1 2Fe-2S iron-sulfur cluster binding domain-containing protein [Noviherbaspirillum sp.]